MCGFFEIVVQPLQERATCFLCSRPFLLDSPNLDRLRVLIPGHTVVFQACASDYGPVEIERLGRE